MWLVLIWMFGMFVWVFYVVGGIVCRNVCIVGVFLNCWCVSVSFDMIGLLVIGWYMMFGSDM